MAYQVRLSQFEGPLDLLLHLIGSAKIRIEDIFVSQVTEQYLEYMAGIGDLDMDAASEFAQMAATLIYIKSRSLLPRREPETNEEDPEEALIERLREYSAVKRAGEALRPFEELGLKRHYKLPEEFAAPPPPLDLSGVTLELLRDIFIELMNRAQEPEDEPLSISSETFSVKEKAAYISNALREAGGSMLFRQLFPKKCSKLEIAVTFVALLEMISSNMLRVLQDKQFDDIIISAGGDRLG